MSLTIRRYMTPSPYTIGDDQTLAAAHRLMRERGIRHLPVLHGGKLVGVVSMRDLYFLETLRDVNPDEVLVTEAMSAEAFAVSPTTPLEEVVGEMAANKYGSVIVVDGSQVVGVFTTVDALQSLLELIRAKQPSRSPERVSVRRGAAP